MVIALLHTLHAAPRKEAYTSPSSVKEPRKARAFRNAALAFVNCISVGFVCLFPVTGGYTR